LRHWPPGTSSKNARAAFFLRQNATNPRAAIRKSWAMHLISSAIADHFILSAHTQSMTNDHSAGLLLIPNP
jgi:hypothetical protein